MTVRDTQKNHMSVQSGVVIYGATEGRWSGVRFGTRRGFLVVACSPCCCSRCPGSTVPQKSCSRQSLTLYLTRERAALSCCHLITATGFTEFCQGTEKWVPEFVSSQGCKRKNRENSSGVRDLGPSSVNWGPRTSSFFLGCSESICETRELEDDLEGSF